MPISSSNHMPPADSYCRSLSTPTPASGDRLFIIADNQAVTNAGIRVFVGQTLNISRFEEATGKKELIRLLTRNPNAIIVLDYTNFDLKGIEDFLILHNRFSEVQWLLFSYVLSEQFIRRVAAEENISILFKECAADEIVCALQSVGDGHRYLCKQVELLLKTGWDKRGKQEMADTLTPTEIEILKLIAQGNSVKEIAAKRVSSTHTIITHKKNIFLKLGVNNVYEATKYALRAGLLELMEYYI